RARLISELLSELNQSQGETRSASSDGQCSSHRGFGLVTNSVSPSLPSIAPAQRIVVSDRAPTNVIASGQAKTAGAAGPPSSPIASPAPRPPLAGRPAGGLPLPDRAAGGAPLAPPVVVISAAV